LPIIHHDSGMATDRVAAARTYYRTIDEGAYDDLEALLAPDFVHERPDRTLEGRDRFVRFMREERPRTDTTHAVDAVFREQQADAGRGADSPGDGEAAVRGRLRGDGEDLFGFVDVFSVSDGDVARLRTYTR
jgi:ketosteroid isomerase-like protein